MIKRLVVTSVDAIIRTDGLPAHLAGDGDEEAGDLKSSVARFEHELVSRAVKRYGSTSAAALHLNISQSSVVRRLGGH